MLWKSEIIVQLGFWLSWLVIPLVYEVIPAIGSFLTLRFAVRKWQREVPPVKLPSISLIIPVYNSADSLYQCIESVARSSYPNEKIRIIIANNHSSDNSFAVYQQAHTKFKRLLMQWIDTDKGKAQALNAAIYAASGKYVVHIDSDGVLEHDALKNIVVHLEDNPDIDALTGTILTQWKSILRTPGWCLRFFRKNEFFEYAQSFLAGREFESQANHLFTMSGAFSAFRREKLLRTKLYNIKSVGEDIDMTFQIRYLIKGKVLLCPNALFLVDPISGFNKLYTQRQRWQRGELEAIHYFMANRLGIQHFGNNFIVRRLVMDHTVLLLRIILLAAFVVLIPLGYSASLILLSFALIYVLYIGICLLNFINICAYLKRFPQIRYFYQKNWYIIITLPLYYLVCSLIQVVGLINAMEVPAKWKTRTFSDEISSIKRIIVKDITRK